MKHVYIIHGWGGQPGGGFKPWLKKELENLKYYVEAPEMPDTNHPHVNAWVDKITKMVATNHENTILVGHSLGGLAILKYLETVSEDKKVNKVVLIASVIDKITGLSDSDIEIVKPWLTGSLDVEKVIKSTNKIVAYFSDNDPYILLSSADFVQNKLKGEVIIESNMGHYNGKSGVYKVPQILNKVID